MSLWQRLTDIVAAAARPGSLLGALSRGGERGAPETDVRFTMALIALLAKMARSDGAVTGDEVDAFGRIVHVPDEERENVRRLFDLAKQDIAGFEDYARQISRLFDGDRKLCLDVIEALFVIAAADGILHEHEDAFLTRVAGLIGVGTSDLGYVRSLFVADRDNPYIMLGLTPSASDADVRQRHRALTLDNHPDRLIGRGVPPEFVAVAERKLAAINAAFDTIARERGL